MATRRKLKKTKVRHATSELNIRKWVFNHWPVEAIGAPGQLEQMEATVQWLMGRGVKTPGSNGAVANKVLELTKRK